MRSHDIKEVAFMADRIVMLSANRGRILTIMDNKLPRPRDYRYSHLLALVDHLHEIITRHELPDIPAVAAAAPHFIEPLPDARPSEVVGLLEYLNASGGRLDIFHIASEPPQGFGGGTNIVKA